MFLNPIKRFVNFFEQLQEGMTGLGRFCEIMDIKPEEEAPDAKAAPPQTRRGIYASTTFRLRIPARKAQTVWS